MEKFLISLLFMFPASLSIYAQWNLNRCLEFAKENNKELLAHKEQISVSDYQKKMAVSAFIPDINFSMTSDYYWEIPVQSYPGEIFGMISERVTIATGAKLSGDYGININWNLIDVQQWQNIKRKTLKSQSIKYGFQSLQHLLLRNVTAAYYSVQIQKQTIELANDLADQYAVIHNLLTQQYEEGLLDKISINQSTTILSEYQKYQSEQEILYQKCLLELKYWMGYPLDESLEITYDNNRFISEVSHEDFHVEYLPDYNEQKTLLEITHHNFKSSKHYMFPKLSLTSSFGQIGFGESFREFSHSSSWYGNGFIGLRLNIPLFSTREINTVKRNRAMYNQSLFQFAHYQERQTKRYFQVRLDHEKALLVLISQRTTRKLAEENLYLCHQKIEHGLIDMIQLKQVQQELIKSIKEENSAKLDCMKNQIELNYLQNEIN